MTDAEARNNGKKTWKPPPVEHQFKPGNPGRPKGSRNKLGEDFIAALADAKYGAAVIERVRAEKPDAYVKVVASLLPKDLNLNIRQLDDLSDAQLLRRLQQVTEMARPLLAGSLIEVEEVEFTRSSMTATAP
jgi:hypothetical protein